MQATEDFIRFVVKQVLAEIKVPPPSSGRSFVGRHGVFDCVDDAVTAADAAFDQLSEHGLETRKRIIDHIRRISID
jgi:hypothetical protein